MRVAVIDYESGNIASVTNALDLLGVSHIVTSDPDEIRRAARIIFPGVGRAAPAMEALRGRGLDTVIRDVRKPFLGICLGMQLLLPISEEDNTPCLGVVAGKVKRFSGKKDLDRPLKVPQIGWNEVRQIARDPLFKGIPDDSFFYFVNSYYVEADDSVALAKTVYSEEFVSILRQGNFYGVQFHPEKSGSVGLALLRNFCELKSLGRGRMRVIPAMDILDGHCVRLVQGDFHRRKTYSENLVETARTLQDLGVPLIHIIDLNGAREGVPVNREKILEIARILNVPIQVGGGIRSYENAQAYLDGGVERVILGTSALMNPDLIKRLIKAYGPSRIAVAADVKDGFVAVKGWQETAEESVFDFLTELEGLGIEFVLLTDTRRDGTLTSPDFEFIQEILGCPFNFMIAGGISSNEDIMRLDEQGAYGVVIGKALYEGKIDLRSPAEQTPRPDGEKSEPVKGQSHLARRIIPCMDIKNGRVVKGTNYVQLRDAGDPVELAKLYSEMGADELVFLDIMATVEDRDALYDLVKRISRNINIPFTVGGGIKRLTTIRKLLQCGADKVSLGSAAVRDPGFVETAARQFGSQCIVISIDPKWTGCYWEVFIDGGRKGTEVDAIPFARQMENLGAGELLVNSLDRDGKKDGYDIDLLRAVSRHVNIPVIASSGAGKKEHFLAAFTEGQADAALAASLFHYRELEIPELKVYLQEHNIPVRR